MPTEQEIIQKRLRQYGEPIATSPQLRESLNDEQANELIEWGLGVLQQEVEETAVLPDTEVHERLDLKETAVSLIMTLVNQLVEHPDLMPDEDLVNSRLQRLGKNLFWITENKNRKLHRQRIAAYNAVKASGDSDLVFKRLMGIVNGYFEDAEEE